MIMATRNEKPDAIPRNRGGRLARRARSFKEDLLERIIQMRSPSSTRAASPHKHYLKDKADPLAIVESKGCSGSAAEDGGLAMVRTNPGDELLAFEKNVTSSLRYFRDVVDKKTFIQLPGSASAILDSVLEIYSAFQGSLKNEQSSLLLSSNNQVYQSLANLIRWADLVMLRGEAAFDKDSVSDTLKTVESALHGLLTMIRKKINEKSTGNSLEQSSHQLPNGLMGHREADACGHAKINEESGQGDQALSSRQLSQTTPFPSLITLGHSISSDSILGSTHNALDDHDLPPPKPPLPIGRETLRPNGRLHSTSSVPDMLPPALPPKKKSLGMWCGPGPQLSHDGNHYCFQAATVCRPSRSSGEWESGRTVSGSDWSSSIGRSPASVSPMSASASSLELTPNLSSDDLLHTVPGDLHFDLDSAWRSSSSATFAYQCQTNRAVLRSQKRVQEIACFESGGGASHDRIPCLASAVVAVCSHHQNVVTTFVTSSSTIAIAKLTTTKSCTIAESTSSSSETPPAIPPKQRGTAPQQQRTPSQYDNVPELTGDERDLSSPVLPSSGSSPLSHHRLTATSSVVFDCNSSSSSSGIADCEPLPPPLPPKKKHVTAYMQVFGSCTESSSASYIQSLHGYGCSYFHQEVSSSSLNFSKSATSFNVVSSVEGSVAFPDVGSGSFEARFPEPNGNTSPPALPPKKGKVGGMVHPDFLAIMPCPLQTEAADSFAEGEHQFERGRDDGENSCGDIKHHGSPKETSSGLNLDSNSSEPCPKDVQVLDELDARPFLIYKKEGEDGPDIRGGTVFTLVVHATLASHNEIAYQDAFMVTYRTFITPMELVNTLLYRFNKFATSQDVSRQRLARSAFSLLVRVVGDFRVMDVDNDILVVLTEFVFHLLFGGELSLARALRKKILEKWNDKLLSKQTSLAPLSSKGVSTKQASLLDFKSEQLAEQMTLLDADLFQEIEIADVLIWSRLQKEELSPNLTTFTEHFNKMSYWVRSRILERDDAKDRERYVVKFIKIMKHLRKMNNFNSYLAILSALDSAPIRRLEWQKHITEGLKEYCELIDSTSSFRSYRQALAETEPPCIPYIGLILQDLTFVHIGNNDFISDNVVNFSKRWQQFNILDMMRRFRKCQYHFKPCDRIIAFFNNFDDHLCEEAMWQISESIKPRGTKKKVEQGGQ